MVKKTAFEDVRKVFGEAASGIKTFERDTDSGTMKACRHVFKGRTFMQTEMTSTQLESIGSLLIESQIFDAIKNNELDVVVDSGTLITHLIRNKLLRRFLVLVLLHEDGTKVAPEEFDGKASEFLDFSTEVFAGFFTLNPKALTAIGMFLTAIFGLSSMAGTLIGMVLVGKN